MKASYETFSGQHVDLVAPNWRDINLDDIARGLAQTNRFGGQSRRPISVAEHSLVVALLARPGAGLAALLHDAHEAYLGDWARPVGEALMLIGGSRARDAFNALRRRLDVAIARRVLEDVEAAPAHGLEIEATILADEMSAAGVAQADDEALRLESSIRLDRTLLQGPTPTSSRANELYPGYAQDVGSMELAWKRAVRAAAFERYAVGP